MDNPTRRIRSKLNEGREKFERLSVNDFVIKAASMALKQVDDAAAYFAFHGHLPIRPYRRATKIPHEQLILHPQLHKISHCVYVCAYVCLKE